MFMNQKSPPKYKFRQIILKQKETNLSWKSQKTVLHTKNLLSSTSLRVLYYSRILLYVTHCVEMSGITYNKENNHKSDFFF